MCFKSTFFILFFRFIIPFQLFASICSDLIFFTLFLSFGDKTPFYNLVVEGDAKIYDCLHEKAHTKRSLFILHKEWFTIATDCVPARCQNLRQMITTNKPKLSWFFHQLLHQFYSFLLISFLFNFYCSFLHSFLDFWKFSPRFVKNHRQSSISYASLTLWQTELPLI